MPKAKLINQLHTNTLSYIATDCQAIDDLKKLVAPEQFDFLISGTFYRQYFKKKVPGKISNPLIAAIEDASNPVMIFWMLVSFFSLGVATLFLAGAFALTSVIILAAGFYSYHRHEKRKNRKDIEAIQLLIIKNQAYDALLAQKPFGMPFKTTSSIEVTNTTVSKYKSIGFGLMTMNLLFCSFYWAMTDSLAAIGMMATASLLAGPIGFAIAVAIAAIIGILFAVHFHQMQQSQKLITEAKYQFTQELTVKRTLLENEIFMRKKNETNDDLKIKQANEVLTGPDPAPSENTTVFSLKHSISQTFYAKKPLPEQMYTTRKKIERRWSF